MDLPPLDRSTVWPYESGEPGDFFYQRYAHPVGAEAERRLGELDGGEALLFASGSAATTAVVLGLLAPGSTVALARGCYYGTAVLLAALARWGISYVEFDQAEAPPDGADLVWLEAPSNPMLTFPDLAAASKYPAPVLVDATAATPALLRPLEHGANLVLHSATKYLGGHSDLLLGALVCGDGGDHQRLLDFRSRTGTGGAPDPAWLLLRGLETLELRVRRQSETALELARRLVAHPRVDRVHYPGLGDALAARYMRGGFGGLLSFEVAGGGAAARSLETSTRVIVNATSLGGTRSSLETRRRWEGDRVPAGLVRLSVGLEDVELLWGDLERALGAGDRETRRVPTPSTFDHVLHADWGAKRTLAEARRDGDRYIASPVRPTTNPLREASAPSCLIGFDFPIGIPLAYARRVAVGSFRELLPQLGHGVWRDFFSPAELPAEISLHRPFYPRKPGGTSHSHLLSALGFSSMDELRRRCDLGYPGRAPAEVLFWTLGPRQVGRAAISGWRDVLMPALGDIRIWPLDGELEDLDGATVVCETYPADYYAQFGLPRAKTAGARREAAPTLLAVARDLGVELPAALRGEIARGFVDDDAYDAFVGLLGMLNVVRGNRTARPPSVERARLEVEGWIFGQA